MDAYGAETIEELEESESIRLAMGHTMEYLREAHCLLETGLAVCQEADGPSVYETTLLCDQQLIERLMSYDSFEKMTRAHRTCLRICGHAALPWRSLPSLRFCLL